MNRITCHTTSLGRVMPMVKDDALVGLWTESQECFTDGLKGRAREQNDFPAFVQAKERFDRYFAGEKSRILELRLEPAGNESRKVAWEAPCQIPRGEAVTYGELAQKIAVLHDRERMSTQAVGGAVGYSAISITILCHRVVGTSGNLTGYADGIDKKVKLLTHEGAYSESFFMPKKSIAL